MKKKWLYSFTLLVLTQPVWAQIPEETEAPCDPEVETCEEEVEEVPRNIYPWKPMATQEVFSRVARLTESEKYLKDIREITARGLTRANTKNQPWGGSYWPLLQGQIANPYQEKNYAFLHGALSHARKVTSWKHNYNQFLKRKETLHPNVYNLSEEELAKLAPSEKYDLLLGDTSFDLTNRVWNYAATWGEEKKWGFLTSIDLPAGYRIPEANSLMALWEGICHGWAVASGSYDRPNKTVFVTLPNGKKMPFYPNDLKALISLMWANSVVQDRVLSEGLRCNRKSPKRDEHGRFIDTELDKNDTELLPRCADVHPAVYHTAVVNILGVEGRSFVVDKSAKASVSNQPVAGYEYKYFNPKTGKEGSLMSSVLSVANYSDDPFKESRNSETKFIVGVAMVLKYVDWEDPIMKETNYPKDDKISEMEFNYDLELDASYQIIGGQWRIKKNGNRRLLSNNTGQPDFFWVVPKNYMDDFKSIPGLPEWNFKESTLPPREYLPAARSAHSFMYQMTREFKFDEQCTVFPIKKDGGPIMKVPCEFKFPRPQPLINVVNKLLEQSRK